MFFLPKNRITITELNILFLGRKEGDFLLDAIELTNNTNRFLTQMFTYIDCDDATLYIYKEKDFPFLKTITQTFIDTWNKYNHTQSIKDVTYLKTFNKKSKLIMFSLLLNNNDINDVTFEFDEISNLINTNFKHEVLHVHINCQYTQYHQFVNSLNSIIETYINTKFNNRIEDI